MEFFDKKEEVIDLELTQFGRHLLSKGKFDPKYYSFFDSNILYNSERAGLTEKQNQSEERIRSTQYMKSQISISSLDKKFENQYEKNLLKLPTEDTVTFQNTPEKNYNLPSPIGMSDINSEFAPSWSVKYLNGTLTGSVTNLSLVEKSGGNNTVFIPQVESHVQVKVVYLDADDGQFSEDELENGPFFTDYEVVSQEEELFLLLKISENNSFFQSKNFDIEVFEIQEEDQSGTIIESLRPLYFPKQFEIENELGFITDVDPETNQDYVDYYLDVLVDDEIDKEIICELDPDVDETLGVFADPRTKECQDIINKRKRQVFNIYEDDADSAGEIC